MQWQFLAITKFSTMSVSYQAIECQPVFLLDFLKQIVVQERDDGMSL